MWGEKKSHAKDYVESSFRPTIPCTLLLSTTKRLGIHLGVQWECYGTEKRENAYCFGQLYEIKVARTLSKRSPLEFPFSSSTSMEIPAFKKIQQNSDPLVPRLLARFSFCTGRAASQSFIGKKIMYAHVERLK